MVKVSGAAVICAGHLRGAGWHVGRKGDVTMEEVAEEVARRDGDARLAALAIGARLGLARSERRLKAARESGTRRI